MHNLSSAFVLGYHGCDRKVAELLLLNEPFKQSENEYDWLGHGVYFWEANPDRAWTWALEQEERQRKKGIAFEPEVVGAVINLGFCLDLTTTNGISTVQNGYAELRNQCEAAGVSMPTNTGGDDRVLRRLDCAVVNFVHAVRAVHHLMPFDSVRGLFPEGGEAYSGSEFQDKTHIQICVREQESIHGVFRVHPRYFSFR